MTNSTLLIVLLSLAFQFLSVIAAVRLLFSTGKRTAGILVLAALCLLIVRRLVGISPFSGMEQRMTAELVSETMNLVGSIFLLACILYLSRKLTFLRQEMEKRVLTEQTLQETTARLQALIYALPDMVIFKDAEGRHLLVNKSAEDFMGLRQELVSGKTNEDLLPADLAASCRKSDEEALMSAGPVQTEETTVMRDGRTLILDTIKSAVRDERGTVSGLVTVSRDSTRRRQAEELSRMVSRQKELILNAAGEGIFGLDRSGCISFINPAAAKMTGWSVDEIIGKSSCDLLLHSRADGSQYSAADCPVRKALESGTVRHADDEVYWRKDGSSFPVEYVTAPIKEQDSVIGAVVVFKDITERRRAEEEAFVAQRRVNSLFKVSQLKTAGLQEFLSAALAEAVSLSESAFGFISYYNNETRQYKLHSWPERAATDCCVGQQSGASCMFYMSESARVQEPLIINDMAVVAPERTCQGQYRSLSRFMAIPVASDGRVICVVGVGNKQTDYTELDMHQATAMMGEIWKIAERKIAEDDLRISEERLRLALAGSNQGLFDLNVQSGAVTVSPEYATMLGYDPATFKESVAASIDRMHPDDCIHATQAFADCLAGSDRLYNVEFRQKSAQGEWKWIHSLGKVVDWDDDGRPLRMVGTRTDITERRRLLSELEDLNKTLAQRVLDEIEKNRAKEQMLQLQSRHAAMGEMIDNIAHQWRQPLNNLGLIMQGISIKHRDGNLTPEMLTEKTRFAMSLIQYMSQTINDFSNFFRQDKEMVRFRVKDVVGTALGFMETRLKRNDIAVVSDIGDDVVINGFRNEYTQVVVNILNNARDVFVERRISNPRVVLAAFRENSASVLTIADNGGGIPCDAMDKIFKPYFTTKEKGKGTGIGLYMAKAIIEGNMAGRLTVENRTGGAEFRIEVHDHA